MNMIYDPKTAPATPAPVMMVETVFCDKNGAPRNRKRVSLTSLVEALKTPLRIG
ncbi:MULTISPECIES: hypothetical protein [Donghicola]|jgi:acetaldehyde dehydrogenase (acetylating)|uniref:Uncharacterized protein n=1 Tax=Donghicola eburneus TaxID=393278 RepID=A0A1M4N2N3_9RHOB|nr:MULTISPECIES: hypothetical protein [Donghicola]MCT4579035.1 hypothetical protein [Donghicola sp.]SCM69091.1 hypothetical protein KARMA_3324 [Donghicola eburneus]SFQ36242.1 hypothetical protein SAMN05421764_103130 [Donghicola eburneus]